MSKVEKLFIYPVKSCAGIELKEVFIDEFGPMWDRRWMFIDETGKFVSQRKYPKMATIKTAIDERGLTLSLPNGKKASVSIKECEKASMITSTVWKDQVEASDCSKEISELISDFLQAKLRLVFMKKDFPRVRQKDVSFAVGFADSMPILLTNLASLEVVNKKLESQITMERFRPNIVTNNGDAFSEAQWTKLRIGTIKIQAIVDCERCVITTIDQSSGEKNGREPLRTISSHFKGKDGRANFGVRLTHENQGLIKVGDLISPTI